MSDFLLQYEKIDPATFAVLSSFLTVSLFFKFSRFWSVRNMDILLLVLFAPGLLLIEQGDFQQAQAEQSLLRSPLINHDEEGEQTAGAMAESREEVLEQIPDYVSGRNKEFYGFILLWAVGGVFLVRLLLDPTMVRRPLLEPNLTSGGLLFISLSLFALMSANVVFAGEAYQERIDLSGPLVAKVEAVGEEEKALDPGFAPLEQFASIPVRYWLTGRGDPGRATLTMDYRFLAAVAVAGHLLIVLGMIATGYWHFNNIRMGIGAGTMYLMLPYTFQMTGQVDHVIPGVLLVWAIVLYRRPLLAGVLLGLSLCIYYPLFLLPLWVSFYWRRGLFRYLVGLLIGWGVLAFLLLVQTDNTAEWMVQLRRLFGIIVPRMEGLEGIWGLGWDPVFRIPVLVTFIAMIGSMALWPPQKNLGTLLCCSAAVMVATRFWSGSGGGLNMAWYLPLILLTIVRPNLEDRTARNVVVSGWPRRRAATFG
jgi:hypothetical protein